MSDSSNSSQPSADRITGTINIPNGFNVKRDGEYKSSETAAAKQDQFIAAMFEQQFSIVEKIGKHKSELSGICINDSSPEEKLNQIRRSILTFRASKGTQQNKTTASSDENLLAQLSSRLEGAKLDELGRAATFLSVCVAPVKEHGDLLDSIGEVIRSNKLTVAGKMTAITDLLL